MNAFKIGKLAATIIGVLIGGLGVILCASIYIGSGVDPKTGQEYYSGAIGGALKLTIYAIVFAAILAGVIFVIKSYVSNPKTLVKTGIVLGILGIMFFMGYMMADNTIIINTDVLSVEQVENLRAIPKKAIKMSDAGLHMFYILLVTAVGTIVATEIIRRFR